MLVLGFEETVGRTWLVLRFINRCRPAKDCMPCRTLITFPRRSTVGSFATEPLPRQYAHLLYAHSGYGGHTLSVVFAFAQVPSSPRHEHQRKQRQTIVCASPLVLYSGSLRLREDSRV